MLSEGIRSQDKAARAKDHTAGNSGMHAAAAVLTRKSACTGERARHCEQRRGGCKGHAGLEFQLGTLRNKPHHHCMCPRDMRQTGQDDPKEEEIADASWTALVFWRGARQS